MKKVLTLLLLTCCYFTVAGQSLQDTLAQIDQLFSRFKADEPGCQLSISRNGQTIYSKAWGMADLEHQAPLSVTSIIEAGSVSKQFTAAAILLLEQQGKLSLNDDIRKYLPEIPDYGDVIRIRHLMHHTSGLRDWGSVMEIAGWPRTTKTYSNDDALMIVSHQKALNNKPGDEYIYSNSNFNLLALIVKRVTGMELAEFTRKNIFEPAGMTHTQWRDNYKRIVLNRAMAYRKTREGFETYMPNEYAYGNGGLLTTTEDLLKWNEFYWGGKLGKPSLLPKQIAPDHLNNGVINPYGAALFIAHKKGWQYINHSGSTAGYRSFLLCYPQLKLSIAYLSNASVLDMALINSVENLFVSAKGSRSSNPENAGTYSVSTSDLQKYTGWYREQKTGEGRKLLVKEGVLFDGNNQLIASAADAFLLNKQQMIFSDHNKKFIDVSTDRDTSTYIAVKEAVISTGQLVAYTGRYYSSEAEAAYTVEVKNGKLQLHLDPVTEIPLNPTYLDGFNINKLDGNLYFERDGNNHITGFKISIPRARNIAFVRLN